MTPASTAIDIPRNDRADAQGRAVSSEFVAACVNYKLAYPTASQAMIGEQVGCVDQSYVSRALRTPYAMKALRVLLDNPFQAATTAATGDSLAYTHKAVRRATRELDKPEPNTSVLTAANQAAGAYIKGILPDKLEVTHRAIDARAYDGLDELDAIVQEPESVPPGVVHKGERPTGHTDQEGSES